MNGVLTEPDNRDFISVVQLVCSERSRTRISGINAPASLINPTFSFVSFVSAIASGKFKTDHPVESQNVSLNSELARLDGKVLTGCNTEQEWNAAHVDGIRSVHLGSRPHELGPHVSVRGLPQACRLKTF